MLLGALVVRKIASYLTFGTSMLNEVNFPVNLSFLEKMTGLQI